MRKPIQQELDNMVCIAESDMRNRAGKRRVKSGSDDYPLETIPAQSNNLKNISSLTRKTIDSMASRLKNEQTGEKWR